MPYIDKVKQKEYAAKHYLKNKEKMKARALANNKLMVLRNKQFVKEYLLQHPCVDCPEDNIIVLEFDHIHTGKTNNISNMILRAYSIEAIKKEIAKCEVRCANCHRIVTHNRRNKELVGMAGLEPAAGWI